MISTILFWQVLTMNKIKVVYSPRKYFEESLGNIGDFVTGNDLFEEYTKLDNTHIHRFDSIEATHNIKYPEFENLVCYGEEFNSMTESYIMSFFSRISVFNIKNIYLQNPPKKIVEQAKKLRDYGEITYEEDHKYKYNNLTIESVKKMYLGFDKKIIGQPTIKQQLMITLLNLLYTKKDKPTVILFYGPTGIGKTETAKYLANIIGGKLFRQQFSMLQNNRAYDYLFGGKQGENSFASDLLNRETNVILLDEFDKVESTFFSAFYELFDEGIYNDSLYKVNLKDAIIICTSNYNNLDEIKEKLGAPIFARINKFIEFKPLDLNSKIQISNNIISDKINNIDSKKSNVLNEEKIALFMNNQVSELHDVREIEKSIESLIGFSLLKDFEKNIK